MDNGAVNGSCQCTLLLGSDGIIYGTTTIGGKYGGGIVFALDAGLAKPKPLPARSPRDPGPWGHK
jgi:uncharacterized repeat protein (TIGR03803 family)